MYQLILSLLIFTFYSCGKEPAPEPKPLNKQVLRQKLKHYLPELQLNQISKIRISFEDGDKKKTYKSEVKVKPFKDYLRKKLIFQTMNKLKNNIRTKEEIHNEEFDLYNINLFSIQENVNYKNLLQKNYDLYESGTLAFNLNLSFKNLYHIDSIESIRFKVEAISKKDWKRKDIGFLKLKKFGDDNERLSSRRQNSITPRHNYRFMIRNIDWKILKKLLTGEYQLGVRLHDLNFKAENGTTHNYNKTIKEFYSSRDFVYIINERSIDRFFKLQGESIFETLSSYDSNIEVSESKQIQLLKNIETKLRKFTTYTQIKNKKPGDGIWTMTFPEENKSNSIVYIESELLKKVESFIDHEIMQDDDFQGLHLSNVERRKILISTQAKRIIPLTKVFSDYQLSSVTTPEVCERYYRFDKGECYTKDLKCTFNKRSLDGERTEIFREEDFRDQLIIGKTSKVLKQWYSQELKTYFMIVELDGDELYLDKGIGLMNPDKHINVGVFQLLNCPSRTEHGFRLTGQQFPARRINIGAKSIMKLKINGMYPDY